MRIIIGSENPDVLWKSQIFLNEKLICREREWLQAFSVTGYSEPIFFFIIPFII